MSIVSTATPELSDVIKTLVDSMMLDMNVCLPAKIVTYDKATQYADVEIQLLQGLIDGTTLKYPIIPSVPVMHPKAGKSFIHMPVKEGDDVVLVFSHRSLDNWKSQGGMSDPQDSRKFHITDAFAMLGGSAMPDSFSPATDGAIEIVNGTSAINVFPDGKFQIMNGTVELITLLQTLVETLSKDTTNTILGPMQLNAFLTYAQIANKIKTLME